MGRISYASMQSMLECGSVKIYGRPRNVSAMALLVLSTLLTTGCLSSLARHSGALSAATVPVIDEAASAYRNAQALHDTKVEYEAVAQFDDKTTEYNPRNVESFPSDQAIQVRLTILEAFKCYVESLVEISNGVSSPQLNIAAKSVGASLSTLGNALAPTAEDALGIAPPSGTTTTTTVTSGSTTTTSSATTAAPLISTASQNIVSTAAVALGEFLVSRKIKKELPEKIKEMDPKLEALCDVLEKDIDILQAQQKIDFNYIIGSQTIFIQGATALDPEQRREQIMKLPKIVRQQRASAAELVELRASIVRLYLTHHALAADAQGNNPESLKAKLSDLSAAGSDLGKFYSSLPTK
jgi:hypothetical protein